MRTRSSMCQITVVRSTEKLLKLNSDKFFSLIVCYGALVCLTLNHIYSNAVYSYSVLLTVGL